MPLVAVDESSTDADNDSCARGSGEPAPRTAAALIAVDSDRSSSSSHSVEEAGEDDASDRAGDVPRQRRHAREAPFNFQTSTVEGIW